MTFSLIQAGLLLTLGARLLFLFNQFPNNNDTFLGLNKLHRVLTATQYHKDIKCRVYFLLYMFPIITKEAKRLFGYMQQG